MTDYRTERDGCLKEFNILSHRVLFLVSVIPFYLSGVLLRSINMERIGVIPGSYCGISGKVFEILINVALIY